MHRLRLSYTRFADLAAGQVGEPGEGYLVSPSADFFVHVRRDDPSEIVAFQIEHFSERFVEGARSSFAQLLGAPIMDQLADLWARVLLQPEPVRELSHEGFESVISEGRIEIIESIPEADAKTRAARIHFLDAVDAWASEPEGERQSTSPSGGGAGGFRLLGHLGTALRDAVADALGTADALVLGADLAPIAVRGGSQPSPGMASEMVFTSDAAAVLGKEAQTRVTLSNGTLQIWLTGLTELQGGGTVEIIAVTTSGEVVSADAVAEGSPPRIAARLAWPDAVPPAQIALAIRAYE